MRMADETKIAWCDSTFNPWISCTKVSPACDNCYASMSTPVRAMKIEWGPGKPRHRTSETTWKQPLLWERQHEKFFAEHGRRRRVFCASLADVFDNEVDPQWLADLMELVLKTPRLNWLLLTKRIGNAQRLIAEAGDLIDYGEGWQSLWGQGDWPNNVWVGATICNREEFDRDVDKLRAIPAAVRFLSIEPLLEDLGDINLTDIDWVIVGGESGPRCRPSDPDWFRSLAQQCKASGSAYFMKQMGGVRDKRGNLDDLPDDLRIREFPAVPR